jgi:hypothetical protein
MSDFINPLSPLAEPSPEDNVITHPRAARIFFYREPTGRPIAEEISSQHDFHDPEFIITYEEPIDNKDGALEEWSCLITDKNDDELNMAEFNMFMEGVFSDLKEYSPQIDLLRSTPRLGVMTIRKYYPQVTKSGNAIQYDSKYDQDDGPLNREFIDQLLNHQPVYDVDGLHDEIIELSGDAIQVAITSDESRMIPIKDKGTIPVKDKEKFVCVRTLVARITSLNDKGILMTDLHAFIDRMRAAMPEVKLIVRFNDRDRSLKTMNRPARQLM